MQLGWYALGCLGSMALLVGCAGDDFTPSGAATGVSGSGGSSGMGGSAGLGGWSGMGGSAGAGTQCEAMTATLVACGLLPSGQPFDCQEPVGPQDACYADCLVAASCEDLAVVLCALAPPSLYILGDCLNGCDTQLFDCGDGTQVPASYRCDQVLDCSGGTDEVGCPIAEAFACPEGTVVPGGVCDGVIDCKDGSDELGCPAPAPPIGQVVQCPGL
jgi:hypothetical protein